MRVIRLTEVEVILAALAAGSAAGASEVATTAFRDAYTSLRDGLRRRFQGRDRALGTLEAERSPDPAVWRAELEADLVETGASSDPDVVAAAAALLELVNPTTVHVQTNYGATAGTISGPITINYGDVPHPPQPTA
jgi:hypothetical protein